MLDFDVENSLMLWVCSTAHDLENALNLELTPHGITHRQWQVLGLLAVEKDMTQAQLALRMNIEAPSLVGILNRMERNGWILREVCVTDRRKKFIKPTPKVAPVWDKIVDGARRVRVRAITGLTPQQITSLKEILSRVQTNLLDAYPSDGVESQS